MVDVVDPKTRSRMMSGIRSKNTKVEVLIRKALHARGFRFRIHRRDLPGSPDIVLPKYRAVIMVNGCFWHGHDCQLFKWPRTRPEFWHKKLLGNIRRDEKNLARLMELGWRVCVLWECEFKGSKSKTLAEVSDELIEWLNGDGFLKHFPHGRTQKGPVPFHADVVLFNEVCKK